MPNDENVLARFIARVKALLPEDWEGQAGKRFRAVIRASSNFTEQNQVRPQDLLKDGIELGLRKLTGLASQEIATAEKNYAEAAKAFTESEDKKIETKLKERSLEIDVSKREAEAQIAHADARKRYAEADLAETKALEAKLELLKRLDEAGMVLRADERGNVTILSKSKDFNRLPSPSGTEKESRSRRKAGTK